MRFALVDCNNFYVSCERAFNPKLANVPVAVLSNNDGCFVARSNEVKALGIPMGAPFFQYKELVKRHGIAVFSSNYSLYGDMSRRVMETLRHFAPKIDVYSIDEAFLDLDIPDPIAFARKLRETVMQWTGIPVSIGMAETKTLAKLANRMAKKGDGVFVLDKPEELLKKTPVEDIWGIGSRMQLRLNQKRIYTAWELAQADDGFIKKVMTVVGLRTVYELRGVSCLSLEEAPQAKKSLTTCKGFGSEISDYDVLNQAVASYTARLAVKLRKQKKVASTLTVYVFPKLECSYSLNMTLPEATAYTPLLIHFAKALFRRLYREGVSYRKVGIMLDGLIPEGASQPDLFASVYSDKQKLLMETVDGMNQTKRKIRFAAEGVEEPWRLRQESRTPRYTTRWDELLTIELYRS